MDVSSILSQIFNSEQLADITKTAGAAENDVTSVLTKALPLVAGQTTQRGFDLGSLASLAGGDTGSILTALLGAGGTQTVSQQSGLSQTLTNSILSAAAPGLLSALTGSGGSNILSLLGGLVGGSGTAAADDTIQTVLTGNTAPAQNTSNGKKKNSFLSFLSSLFGGKKK
ncbi:MAG: hypothetical protein J5493_06780 [Lachnospiraceae bacterium]|nr:hypothetical protein [Lachnospiraceae bacterium]